MTSSVPDVIKIFSYFRKLLDIIDRYCGKCLSLVSLGSWENWSNVSTTLFLKPYTHICT